jgi:hypothetical protein
VAEPGPQHETDDAQWDSDRAKRSTPRWKVVLAIVIAIALLGLIVLLHLSGTIGPGAH